MHVIRRKARQRSGAERVSYHLRHGYRDEAGKVRERVLYLGSEAASDIEGRAEKVLVRTGYTPAERREILAALRARRDLGEGRPIVVRSRPVAWRDPPGRA